MRQIKRFFSMYAPSFWAFVAAVIVLTALICTATHAALPETPAGSAGGLPLPIRQDLYLSGFSFAVICCVFMIEGHKRKGASLLSRLSVRAGIKFSGTLSDAELTNYHATVTTLAALMFVFTAYTGNAFVAGRDAKIMAALFITLFIILAALVMCVLKGLSERARYILIGVCMVFPVTITLISEDVNAGYTPNLYAWIVTAITFSMLLLKRRASKPFFKLFACVLLAGIFFEAWLSPEVNFIHMVGFVSNIFYAGFVIYAPLDYYMERSLENNAALEEAYRVLQETQVQLVQREQMVTLGQLIAGVAHEINTPIGAIKASVDILDRLDLHKLLKDTRRYDDDALEVLLGILGMCTRSTKNMRSTMDIRRGRAQIRKFLESIDMEHAEEISTILAGMEICDVEKIETQMDLFRRDDIMDILGSARSLKPYISSVQNISFASGGVSKIIFSLKSFSHMNVTGEKHPFDLMKNIDNVLVLYHNHMKRGVQIIRECEEDLPLVNGNVEEISQVWTNIIQNAIYAMSYVGTLTITAKSAGKRRVQVSFEDTGPGISEENMTKLFQPFFTTKPLGEGSGLGLDICKKVVEKHGGTITVDSAPGCGATFTVTLPAIERAEADTEAV